MTKVDTFSDVAQDVGWFLHIAQTGQMMPYDGWRGKNIRQGNRAGLFLFLAEVRAIHGSAFLMQTSGVCSPGSTSLNFR